MDRPLRPVFVLRNNIASLLAARKETGAALARHARKHKTWISQFLTGKRDELQLSDLDKIADFFGLSTYQLFQPGISRLTERRVAGDRRSGVERRVGHQGRELAGLRAELNKLPAAAAAAHGQTSARASADLDIQRAIERAAREIHAIQSRQQAAGHGAPGASLPPDRRKVRRPAVKPA